MSGDQYPCFRQAKRWLQHGVKKRHLQHMKLTDEFRFQSTRCGKFDCIGGIVLCFAHSGVQRQDTSSAGVRSDVRR